MAFPHNTFAGTRAVYRRSFGSVASPTPSCQMVEGDHQLEKLEFALAVALSKGDDHRSAQLRLQIEALGGNQEEPGT